MKMVWDEPKRQTNMATHGFDLADAESFNWETAIGAIGRLSTEIVTLVFSPLGAEAISVISLRPASRAERKLHDKT